MKEIEYKGMWWLPENQEKCISGILKFDSNKGAHLELIGKLAGYEMLKTDIILGITSNGKKITLYKCFELNKTLGSEGFSTTIVYANMIFEGVYFNLEQDIKFNEVSCHYSNLDEWAWMDAINIKSNKMNELEIKYKLPQKLSIDVNEKYTVEIYPKTETSQSTLVKKEFTIIQKIYAKIISKKSESFKEIIDKVQHVKQFITLGIGKPIAIIDIIAKTDTNKQEIDGKTVYPEVRVYSCVSESSKMYETILPTNMLFNLRDIGDVDVKLKSWFNKEKILKPILNLYFDTLYNSNMYLEQKFSNLVQAIEAYHRRTTKNIELEFDEHNKRIHSILGSVDNEYKEWLEKKLKYSNEPNLRKRLDELVKECSELIKISSSKKRSSFINKVCATRNYFTHYDSSLSDKAAKGEELLYICNKLKVILEFNLLLEIGFEKELAKMLISKKYKSYTLF